MIVYFYLPSNRLDAYTMNDLMQKLYMTYDHSLEVERIPIK